MTGSYKSHPPHQTSSSIKHHPPPLDIQTTSFFGGMSDWTLKAFQSKHLSPQDGVKLMEVKSGETTT